MASLTPGHVSLGGLELVLQDGTYVKELQTPFNPRFSTGEPNTGDLSFFQYLTMEDWSGGSGQEVFVINNRFSDGENIDVTEPGELKLAPLIEFVAAVNGPLAEHLNRPVEEEDSWPQITEWLGQAIIYNDTIEFDAGGVEFLEVYETDVAQEDVINHDTSGTVGVITNDTRAEILTITRTQGLPGDTFQVKVRFKNIVFELPNFAQATGAPIKNYSSGYAGQPFVTSAGQVFSGHGPSPTIKVSFRLFFGGNAEKQTLNFAEQILELQSELFSFAATAGTTARLQFAFKKATLNQPIDVDFTIRVPSITPGIYKLWTDAGIAGYPFEANTFANANDQTNANSDVAWLNANGSDGSANANVLFFVQSVGQVIVTRKNLYAPQLKATAIMNSLLVGGRVIDGTGYVEVYEKQNEGVDRTLQVNLNNATVTPATPTYMQFVANNDVVIAAFDNRIYSIDVLTTGLTAAQRFTFIGQVPGDYVSGMALWNQKVYIASFSKSSFTSVISWTDGVKLQGSYAIDGKFWITDLANFNGALFYSGGRQNGRGEVRLFPSDKVIELSHPTFDSRVRSLNAGRVLYFGHSHGTGVGTITERGVSKWATKDLGEDPTNVVWDIEEVGDTVFFLADGALFKTTPRFAPFGFWKSSQIGGNTALINKVWTSVTIETGILSGGHTIRVYVRSSATPDEQWNLLGSMVHADGIQKEFLLPPDYQAQWIEVRIEMETTDPEETPIVKRLLTKYVPATLNKLQWAFSARATDGLVMLDGHASAMKGVDLISAIWELKNVGVIPYRDADGINYDVIVTDISQTVPLLDKRRPEAFISIELLET